MITNESEPVSWALLLYELDDAHEHLEKLINEMGQRGSIDEEDYRIQVGHVYSHLNRAWNGRSHTVEWSETDRQLLSKFPTDLEPVG